MSINGLGPATGQRSIAADKRSRGCYDGFGTEPVVRAGVDPPGRRFTIPAVGNGVYSWRFPMMGPGAAILIEFWQGVSLLTWRFIFIFTLLALVPLLWVGAALRNRLMERAVWRAAAKHDPSVLPLLASWRLIRRGEYIEAGIVLSEAAVLVGLIVHPFR